MKRRPQWMVVVLTLLLGWDSPVATAQIAPVRLKVTKELKKGRAGPPSAGSSSAYREESQKISYTIEVAAAGTQPVPDIQIKWAILYKPQSATALEFIEGERTCSLKFGQKYIFETDPVDLEGTTYISPYYGRFKSASGAQLIGFAVEVFVKGAIVASEIQPSIETKRRIEQIRKLRESRGLSSTNAVAVPPKAPKPN